jgi:hypothetical protein
VGGAIAGVDPDRAAAALPRRAAHLRLASSILRPTAHRLLPPAY